MRSTLHSISQDLNDGKHGENKGKNMVRGRNLDAKHSKRSWERWSSSDEHRRWM